MARLRYGEWIAGAGGVALLAAMFLHWYGAGPFAVSAWRAFAVLDIVLALLALVPFGLVFTHATRPSPSIPVAFSVCTMLGGALAALLILYRIVNQPGPNDLVEVEAGAWLGFAAALAIAAGGWRSLRIEAIPGAPLPPIEDLPAPSSS